jgi:hypothetical protein
MAPGPADDHQAAPGPPRVQGPQKRHGGVRELPTSYVSAIAAVLLTAVVLFLLIPPTHSPRVLVGRAHALPACGVACDPIDPRYLLDVPYGTVSFWLQPWRAYLDTWNASRLPQALGADLYVGAAQAAATARVLHESGFTLARIEIDWSALSYRHPTRFTDPRSVSTILHALRRYDLRPLIVLSDGGAAPCPWTPITLSVASGARAGARSVRLSPASAALVLPGRTALSTPHGGSAAIITSVTPGGVATLSSPLPSALAAGPHPATRLLYAPFGSPTLASGAANPTFQATLAGWLSYVDTVSSEASRILGPSGFDLEVWNGVSSDTTFLGAAERVPGGARRPVRAPGGAAGTAVLDSTVAFVRSPASGLSEGVGVSDGFASQTPLVSGVRSPVGLTALSKDPNSELHVFPASYEHGPIPIDALGRRDTRSRRSVTPRFIPSLRALLPEYSLLATSTDTLVRDIAPLTTDIGRLEHGRYVGPAGGGPVQKWVTQYDFAPSGYPVGPDGETPLPSVRLTAADRERFQAKALLRSLVAMVSAGVTRMYFSAAGPGAPRLVGPEFWADLRRDPAHYPAVATAGQTLNAFRDLLGMLRGPGPEGNPARLALLSITQSGHHAQFSGDGTAAHPSLYDRDALAVFPYQSSPTRFVVAVYVMTRDMLTLYRPGEPADQDTRFDLPEERFRITLAGLPESGTSPSVAAYDPLQDRPASARLISRHGGTAQFEIAATDYPRLLTIQYR